MQHTAAHVGILKHTAIGIVENQLSMILRNAGYMVSILNPFDGDQSHITSLPNIVIARCEVSSSQDKAFSAYMQYFSLCNKLRTPVINPKEFFLLGQHKFNSHRAVHQYLRRSHIQDDINPPTTFTTNQREAWHVGTKEIDDYGSVVVKQPYSGRGDGVFLITNKKELASALQWPRMHTEGILLQRTIEKEKNSNGGYRDARLLVCRDAITREPKIINAYYRNAPKGQFLTNVHEGGYISPMNVIDERLHAIATTVMNATCGDVAGIDVVRDTSGHWWFEEVNVAFEVSTETSSCIGDALWGRVLTLVEARLRKTAP